MASPRIDHPEFAEFICRFYGVSRPEAVAQRQPSQDRPDALVTDSSLVSPAEMAAKRRSPRRIGEEMKER